MSPRAPRAPAIWMIAPGGRGATGGICRVVALTADAFAARGGPPVRVLDSGGMSDRARMGLVFARALLVFAAACARGRVRLAHIHVATGGSLVRKAGFVAIARAYGVPVALHMHGAGFDRFHAGLPRPARSAASALFRAADAVIVLGAAGREDAIARLSCRPSRVHVVANAVADLAPPDRAAPPPPAGAACRLLFLGALVERKGLDVLLDALARPALRALDWRLAIAGNGATAPWASRAAAGGILERVDFLGWTDPATALAGADLLVLPSRAEGMPMAILEAMSAGRAVIATRVGEIAELVRDGETGLLVEPGDVASLAAAIAALVPDPDRRRSYGRAARRAHAAAYGIDRSLERLDRVFDAIAPAPHDTPTPPANREIRMRPTPTTSVVTPLASRARPTGRRPAPLRISCYMHSLAAGGVERMRVNLLRQFDAWGASTTLLLHADENRVGAALPARTGLTVFGTRRTAFDLLPLIRHLRRDRPDLLLVSLGHNNVVAMAAKLLARSRCRLVVCQHNALSAEVRNDRRYRILPLAYRLLSPLADHVVAVSEGVAADLAAVTGIDRARIEVIPNPVVTAELAASIAQPNDDPWFRPDSPPVYVAVGRLVRQKDHATLLRAFALHRRQVDCRLAIIGEGPLLGALEALAQELGIAGDVRFLGFRENPLPYMRDAAALVLSSLWEGLGNVLVEALACGTPVIATDCPHGPAEILDGGRYGRLVRPGDHVALAAALDPTLRIDFPPARLRARAASYSVEVAAQRYLDLGRAPASGAPAPRPGMPFLRRRAA